MNVRAQIAMVFHLDKCIGCHTCSVACKNIWTDRKGAEYMWWNNVETKPGTGYPTQWEDQEIYQGGWQKHGHRLELKASGHWKGMTRLYHNPYMPNINDYYEPFSYDYQQLINAPADDDQPTARPISLVTGKPMDIKGGPNWDDDLSGTPDYARSDVNLRDLSAEMQEAMFQLERMVMFYLPRICNHCLNPACVAACPSGAIYKRAEDGVVLVNQDKCRGWRLCISACPYKKVYYNWKSGKSEKCILCYPRLETGQVPACMHSCVGRIRYLGVLLYDADKIETIASVPEEQLLSKHRDIYLDPFNKQVVQYAKDCGIPDSTIVAAQKSPVYKFVKEWQIALPLHPEFRTLPSLFYVPPLLPIMSQVRDQQVLVSSKNFWGNIDEIRIPIAYLAQLFAAGNEHEIECILKKQLAVRYLRRFETVGDVSKEWVESLLSEVHLNFEIAHSMYHLTSL
ncbi:MAG TPA: nitrate reductase subunit beta, partial [Bacteroidales bacterium]|nr:nitrate reductase subunit beta [Bacteroidales bacterium]